MESIGLFEAKTHLSDLVARAERGEETVITRHNKPVACIVPVRRSARASRGARDRERALAVLAGFEPIDVPGASIEELIRSGRR